jgi:hypothetical protein
LYFTLRRVAIVPSTAASIANISADSGAPFVHPSLASQYYTSTTPRAAQFFIARRRAASYPSIRHIPIALRTAAGRTDISANTGAAFLGGSSSSRFCTNSSSFTTRAAQFIAARHIVAFAFIAVIAFTF